MERKILPRCPRCGSLQLSVVSIQPAFTSWLVHQEGEEEPVSDIDASISELTKVYSSMTTEEVNAYYEELLRPKPNTYTTFSSAYSYVNQLQCRTCNYNAFTEELGLVEWSSSLHFNTEEEVLGDFKVKMDVGITGDLKKKYERRMKLYTTENIADLAEFLADPELSPIAKRRFDTLTKLCG